MKLNLGCGFRKKENFINVDQDIHCAPDVVCDLAQDLWPWTDDSITEVSFEFSLEQMGETRSQLMHVFKELHRVCRNDAVIKIVCLYPRHDMFFLNPMNTHRLSAPFFHMLSIQANMQQIGQGVSDNCLALQYGFNFKVSNVKSLLTPEIHQRLTSGEMSEEQVRQRMQYENNICQALEVDLVAVKLK